ncbi:hypothetical protein ABEB36_000497 [Hypothenemus hampei]|uniref:Peptidase M12B domain-containing protein n=1 Tax=Hypothenemus hampei TaxID=57062 RepID=A0ABD1FF26_HYPHA
MHLQNFKKSCYCIVILYVSKLIHGKQEAINGRYTRNIEDYEFSVPRKLTPTGDFVSFRIAHFFQHQIQKRSANDSQNPEALHVGIHIGGRLYHAVLWPNYDLVSPSLVIETRDPEKIETTKIHDFPELCYYRGKIREVNNSKAALAICDGLVGSVTLDNKKYFIEPLEDHEPNDEGVHLHVVFKPGSSEEFDNYDSLVENRRICRMNSEVPKFKSKNIKRSFKDSYSDGYIETMIICDKSFLEYHRDLNRERYILTVFNMASDYLHDSSLGQQIDLILVRLLYLDKEEKELDLKVTHDAKKTLESFCKWQQKFNPSEGNVGHADIALLLTRMDVCYGKDCEIVGQSFIGSPCKKGMNCAFCEDNGLELGLVIAHQIGHLLGASNDGLETSKCPDNDPNDGTPYIMSPNTNLSAIRWSECSKQAILATFQKGLADCFINRPPPTPYMPDPVLPGVIYDWQAQCHFIMPGSIPCPTDESQANICKELRCLKPFKVEGTNLECFSLKKPPADGTKCDENMWCFQGKCVKSGQRPETVDGDWSPWGSWSTCTRTCGRGISYALRECNSPLPGNGGRYCDGDKIRYKVCNTNNCPENATSFRQQQCDSYNDIPDEEGSKHSYQAFFNPEAPCALWCSTEDGVNDELNPMVKDGTRCRPGKKDVCVNGECWKVGCDNMLNSNAVEDACGTCNGDGTGCEIVDNTFTDIGDKDYTTVVRFPIGARKISIKELEPSPNVIVITDNTERKFYLNGKYTEQNDGVYKFGKTEGIYTHSAPNQEKLVIRGPLQEVLVFKLMFLKRENVGYQYQYANMLADGIEEPKFHWEIGDMGDCSARCSGGIQIARLDCVEEKAGKVSDTFCSLMKSPDLPTQHCNTQPCTIKWKTGKWSKCNACKGKPSVQKRGIECIEENPNPLGEDILIENDRCPEPAPGKIKICSSDKNCRDKRYIHYIDHSHLGDVWIKMQPKNIDKSFPARAERSASFSIGTDKNETESVSPLATDKNETESVSPLATNKNETESVSSLAIDKNETGSTLPLACQTNHKTSTISPHSNDSYVLDLQPEKNDDIFIYPLKKNKNAKEKEVALNEDLDPADTLLEDLEEDKENTKNYTGKDAAQLFKAMVKSGKDLEESQRKKVDTDTVSTPRHQTRNVSVLSQEVACFTIGKP